MVYDMEKSSFKFGFFRLENTVENQFNMIV